MLGRRGQFEGVAFRNAESGHPASSLFIYRSVVLRPVVSVMQLSSVICSLNVTQSPIASDMMCCDA